MSYSVKEIYSTVQGEGFHTGRPATFLRFTGCNLWSGRERDRLSAVCQFCDTDFVGTDGTDGATYSNAHELSAVALRVWQKATHTETPFVVVTGGEPLLQLDDVLIDQLHNHGFEIAIETNGTMVAPSTVDWVCVSPKAHTQLVQRSGDELKLVFPQIGAEPELYESLPFDHFFLQPMDGAALEENVDLAIEYTHTRPQWQLSIQTHKYLGIR